MNYRVNPDTGLVEILVDRTNPQVMAEILQGLTEDRPYYIGLDIETEDSKRHAGLNEFMKLDAESEDYKKSKKLVFDLRRTNITGFSLYVDGDKAGFYFNTGHADVENRLPIEWVVAFLTHLKAKATWIIHNAAFEIAQMRASWGFEVGPNYICTMQMAVSAYNDDEYPIAKLKQVGLGGIVKLLPEISRVYKDYAGKELSTPQRELLNKVVDKVSVADHSYNGLVRSISYGYGLKKAVKSFFGYNQTTFEETLNGKAHMGLLTGAEVLHYGVDDAYWAVRLFKALLDYMLKTNPGLWQVFLAQENPMPAVWADCWVRGMRVNLPAIQAKEHEERAAFAAAVRSFVQALRGLTFTDFPCPRMAKKQGKWYLGAKGDAYLKYRERFVKLATQPVEQMTDLEVALLVTGAVPSKWASEQGVKLPKDAGNLTHYMMARVLFHDLCDLPFVYIKGDIASNAEVRGKLRERVTSMAESDELWLKEIKSYELMPNASKDEILAVAQLQRAQFQPEPVLALLDAMDELAKIEQRVKLYITPYLLLTDPETGRMYPTIRSTLNTRRMAAENPNTMQMTKRGDGTYVRGFFIPERDDHVYLSIDWSQVELVLIGEHSKDPGFYAAYGHLPYNDLHLGAAASAVQVFYPDFSPEMLKHLTSLTTEEVVNMQINYPLVLANPVTKEPLEPKDAYKWWRNNAGKPSNFGYWYSGSLMTVQDKLGWTSDDMWRGTENYRQQFPIAEQWRVNTINEARTYGFVWIFDGHRRTRYEATAEWLNWFCSKFAEFGDPAVAAFGQIVAKRIFNRAGNQVVNAKIQGGCATLAKRSILRANELLRTEGWDAYFVMPIHDELVFSVHRDQVVALIPKLKHIMCNHPELVSWLKLDATASIGLTLEPYHAKKAPMGQIELDEAPSLEGYLPAETQGKKLTPEQMQRVVDYLFDKRDGRLEVVDAAA